jgi:hypothetical protein
VGGNESSDERVAIVGLGHAPDIDDIVSFLARPQAGSRARSSTS